MSVRRVVHRFLIVFGIVVAASFGYGGYLIRVRWAPPKEFFVAPQTSETVDGLLRNGAQYLETKHVEQALIAYRQALTLAPASIGAQLGVARGELMAGRESDAAREYERVLQLDHDNSTAFERLARIYSHQRETWAQSETKYKELLRMKPGDETAQLELARVLAWERKSEEAVEFFSRDAIRRQMTWQDQKDYAFALVRAGRSGNAEPVLKKLLASRPNDSEIKLQLAAIYASRRDWDAALPIYEALLRENSNDARLNLTYGLGLLSTKKYKSALGPLEKARQAMPSSSEAGLAYARALKGGGNLKKAAQEFGRIAATSQDPGTIREYADLLLEKHDYREAEKFYKQALRLGLRDTRLLMGLAGALRGNGKYREALPYFQEVYAKEPSDRVAFELASTLQKTGQHKEALALLARIDRPAR
jgi:tetratricopeptide (TPR) repeat protein